eukprot:jgi/Chlat1/1705/Chrsp127S01960
MAANAVDEQWDKCIDLTLRRTVYGSLAGGLAALLLFRRASTRAAVLAFGAGTGIGSAYTDCNREFRTALPTLPSRSPLSSTPPPAPEEVRQQEGGAQA